MSEPKQEMVDWLCCPRCGGKTRTQIRPRTVLEDFPLFCPKCKSIVICVVSFSIPIPPSLCLFYHFCAKKARPIVDLTFSVPLAYKGFQVADISDCGINLMYLPLAENAEPPRFKACAKHPQAAETGFVLYYTDQCPYTYYWVPRVEEVAQKHGMKTDF